MPQNSSYIDPSAFDSAYEFALRSTDEHRLGQEFIERFTKAMVAEHIRLRVPQFLNNREGEIKKIRIILEDLKYVRGIEFILEQRLAVLANLRSGLENHKTLPEIPALKKRNSPRSMITTR